MRLFRSQTVEGPYLDAQGNSPILENGENNFDFGIKLAGNYQFSNQPIGYRAPGHNSVIRTQDGRLFNVFHTRFDVGNEHHQVRVHSMFMNQSEWPVMAPFEYLGDDAIATGFDNSQVAGSYEIINHGTDNGNTMIPSQTVQFGENGEITGDVTGNWSYSGTDGFLTLEIGGVRYDGVLLHQLAGARDPQIETTFSSYGQNNESIWGLKLSS